MARYVKLFCMMVLITLPLPSHAVTPEEILSDPVLEQRARALSQQLRCLVCQNQSIDDSDAELAQDLRANVRQQLLDGKSDEDILEHIRNQFGDYVLLKPPVSQQTIILWAMPFLLIVLGIGFIVLYWFRPYKTQNETLANTKRIENDENASVASTAPILPSHLILIGSGGLILASLGLYILLGQPQLDAKPLADRSEEINAARQINSINNLQNQKAFEQAQVIAEANPESISAQLNLAMQAANQEQTQIEINALRKALTLTEDDATIIALLAEALSREAQGIITLPVRELLQQALAKQPNEPRALYLSGLAEYQNSNYQNALNIWYRLWQQSTDDAPWLRKLETVMRQAAREGELPVPDLNIRTDTP